MFGYSSTDLTLSLYLACEIGIQDHVFLPVCFYLKMFSSMSSKHCSYTSKFKLNSFKLAKINGNWNAAKELNYIYIKKKKN